MAGILPDEGETLIANLVFKNADVDRGTALQLLLFTNATIGETTTAASLTEPAGTGYARITLTDANWTVTAGVASYAVQTFTVGTGGWTGSVYGYAVVTTGTTPRIVAIELDLAGPFAMASGDTYAVTPSITVA